MENFPHNPEKEKEPQIKIFKGSGAPEEKKKNPFYNEYHWGYADWDEKELYLPESDEAISFAIAAHELGHMVDKDRIQPDRFDFEPGFKEEIRAWNYGISYLKKHLDKYYDNQEIIRDIEIIINEIKKIIIEITVLGKNFYKETKDDIQQQRADFLKSEEGKIVKEKFDSLRNEVEDLVKKLGRPELAKKVNWDKYILTVKACLRDIESDNARNSK